MNHNFVDKKFVQFNYTIKDDLFNLIIKIRFIEYDIVQDISVYTYVFDEISVYKKYQYVRNINIHTCLMKLPFESVCFSKIVDMSSISTFEIFSILKRQRHLKHGIHSCKSNIMTTIL